jgi:hypothetical protein
MEAFGTGLLLSLVLAALFFPSLINLPFVAVSREIAGRFFIEPMVLMAPFVAVGLAAALRRVGRISGVVVALVVIISGVMRFPQADWRRDTAIERYVVAIVSDLPQGSVVLGSTDTLLSAMHWRAWVLHVRPDVHYVETVKLRSTAYREEISREVGVSLPQEADSRSVAETTAFLASRVPTFLIPGLAGEVAGRVQLDPWGLLLKALPDGGTSSPPEEQNARLARATQLFGDPSPAKSAWSSYILASVAAPWDALADAYAEQGRQANAQAAKGVAALFEPRRAGGENLE